MTKTTALRGLVVELLGQLPGITYHRQAPDDAAYPYKVYTLERVDLADLSRDDYDLCVDIWDRGNDPKTVEEIADRLCDLLNAANVPRDDILPTFFRDNSYPVEDPDKKLIHQQLHFTVQLYTV